FLREVADLPGFLDHFAVEPDHGSALGDIKFQVVPLAGRLGGLGVFLWAGVGVIANLELFAVDVDARIRPASRPELQANDATAAVLPRRVDIPLRFLDIEMDYSLADAPARLVPGPAVEVLAVVQPGEAFLRRSIVRSARNQWQGDEGDEHATASDE